MSEQCACEVLESVPMEPQYAICAKCETLYHNHGNGWQPVVILVDSDKLSSGVEQ